MSVPTLLELIEQEDVKHQVVRILIGGTELPVWTSVSYTFSMGSAPTATIVVPRLADLPSSVVEEAAVQIWFGYRHGVTTLSQLVFGGGVVDSVGNDGPNVLIEVAMDGPRKLVYSYNRRILYDFDLVTANEAVTALLDLAGVKNYYVNLTAWLIGSAVPQTLNFSTYGEAVNKVSTVDGSPWYAMPTGQVRVDLRDQLPSPTPRRTFFASVLVNITETPPTGIVNPLARPRILENSRRKLRDEVGNFIEVDGAVVTTTGPLGEQNSEQIFETVDGLSGQFPNGAYWIPTPPLFQDFTYSNELIDTNAKAFAVAERYFDLKNRLLEEMTLSIPGDPDIFLGMTVRVKDVSYGGVDSLYFIKGYTTTITSNNSETQLNLVGGPEAGTTGFARPFAEFIWSYSAYVNKGGPFNPINLGPKKEIGAKLCEDLPEGTGDPEQGGDLPVGEDKAVVYIGLDGTPSQDFDGHIVSWVWTWEDDAAVEHTLNGPRQTLVIDPALQTSVEVTLTVTDNSGRTDAITKTVRTSVNATPGADPYDPTDAEDDTEEGGGESVGECSEPEFPNPYGIDEPGMCEGLERSFLVAAKTVAMGSVNNRTWNDLTKAAAGATGDFISVDAAINNNEQRSIAIFGTAAGEIVRSTDNCDTGEVVFTVEGAPRIESIHFDTQEMGEQGGELPEPELDGEIPIYTQASPGTMTILQAYQQARKVGFSHDTAVIAVAIMKGESGLYSAATNTAGNTPPSTDRGIVQINSYYHPNVTEAQAFNTQFSIEYMHKISSGGSSFSPWAVYTGGKYQNYLPEVIAAVGGMTDTNVTPSEPTQEAAPSGMKIWAGTSDGRLYQSLDSGKNWELYKDFGDGLPILQIATPPRFGAQTSSLWVFGGDTGDIGSLVRIDPDRSGNFTSLDLQGEIKAAILAAGAGDSVRSSMNETASILVFSGGGMTERVWTSLDPLGDPTSWISCGVTTGSYNNVVPGFGGEFVIAGSTVFKTTDNENFTGLGAGPSTINHMVWRGMPGLYTAALDDGLYQSLDFGDTFGPMRPNTEFSTTWPAGAVAYQVAIGIGARTCPEPVVGDCEGTPFYEAAAGKNFVGEYLSNEQLLSTYLVGSSDEVENTALAVTVRNGSQSMLAKESGSGTSLEIVIEPTVFEAFMFLAIVSRPGNAPSGITDSLGGTWTLIQSTLSTDDVGNIRLSIYRSNVAANAILGLTVTVTFGSAQDVILAIVNEFIGLTTAVGDSPVTQAVTAANDGSPAVNYPDDYLLSYAFTNSDGNFEEAILMTPSFGIALQLEPCSGDDSQGLLFVLEGSVSGDLVIASRITGAWDEVSRPAGLVTSGVIFNTFFTKLGDNHWLVVNDNPNNRLYKSSDGGITFSQKLVTSEFGLPICQAADSTLWAHANTAGTGKIYKSIDDGENWTEVHTLAGSFPLIESATAHPTDENVIVFTGIAPGGSDLPLVVVTTDGSTFTEFTLGSDPDGFSQYETLAARFLASGRFVFLAQVNSGANGRVDGWWTDTPGVSGSYTAEIVGPVLLTNDYGCDALTALSPKGEPIFAVVSPCTAKGIRIFRSADAENWTEISVAGLPASFPPMAVFYDEPEDILYVWGFVASDGLWALADASGAATSWSQITGAAAAIGEAGAFAFNQMNIAEV